MFLGNNTRQLILKHFISQFQALHTLQLTIQLLSLHKGRIITKYAIEHFLLRQLKAVSVSDLRAIPNHGDGLNPMSHIDPDQFEELQLLPREFLLRN